MRQIILLRLYTSLCVLTVISVSAACYAQSPIVRPNESGEPALWFGLWLFCLIAGTAAASFIAGPLDHHLQATANKLQIAKSIISIAAGLLGGLYLADTNGWPIPGLRLAIWSGLGAMLGPTIVITMTLILPSLISKTTGSSDEELKK